MAKKYSMKQQKNLVKKMRRKQRASAASSASGTGRGRTDWGRLDLWSGLRESLGEEGRILWVPLLILLLIILIKIAEPSAPGRQTPAAPTETSEAAEGDASSESGAGEAQSAEAENSTELKEHFDDTMEAFFQRYFEARLKQDTDTLYTMTGSKNKTEAETAALKERLKAESGYIESYSNFHLYSIPGVKKSEYLIFLTYDIKFRRAKTAAPGMMYCYLRVNEKNTYEIVENLQPKQQQLVHRCLTQEPSVKSFVEARNSKLLETISSDERLADLYSAFTSGRIYKEDRSVIDSEVSLLGEKSDEAASVQESESAAAESSGAESQGDGVQSQPASAQSQGDGVQSQPASAQSQGDVGQSQSAAE